MVDLTKRGLSKRDRAILDFERQWWKYEGRKVVAIRTQLGMTEVRFYARLSWLLDQPAALEYDALTVKRLQRLRDRRRAVRTG